MKNILTLFICLFPCFLGISNNRISVAFGADVEFRHVAADNNISNMQINCMLRDSHGFIWIGTGAGLNRYDGYRFRTFFSQIDNEKTLLNDCIDEIYEDRIGQLWIHTSIGYCIYDPLTETFNRKPEQWLNSVGGVGSPDRIFIDSDSNMWIAVNGKGCYFLDAKTGKLSLFSIGRGPGNIPEGTITSMAETDKTVVAVYNNGMMVRLDGYGKRVMWTNRHIPQMYRCINRNFSIYIDKYGNYWLGTDGMTMIYSTEMNKWFDTVSKWLNAKGIKDTHKRLLVRDIVEDGKGIIWVATDHNGLIRIDLKSKQSICYRHDSQNSLSLPGNTVQSLMLDNNEGLWVGTYKDGLVYYWNGLSVFDTLWEGDICTITEDREGDFWLGSNDAGIIRCNNVTGQKRIYNSQETGLGTDIVVCSLRATDGSLWFGAYNGGLARYKNEIWTTWRAGSSGLASDNVWNLAEDAHGNILIGTLGGGFQILNPHTGIFSTYNFETSGLLSDYVQSVALTRKGCVLIGHSRNFSIYNPVTHKITNYTKTKEGRSFIGPSVNQIMEDRRGLIWIATQSGVNIYDVVTDHLYLLNVENGLGGIVAGALAEDGYGNMWVTSDRGIVKVSVTKRDNQWDFSVINYNSLDGLQKRRFNFRSILQARNGDMLFGGQDGVNVFPHGRKEPKHKDAHVIFSGLVLFDHALSVGEEYNDHVVLKEALDMSRRLELCYLDNSFTIQLASNVISVPSRERFYYRLKGFSDKWMMTQNGRSEVTFTNLSPGSYTLQVRLVSRDGNICDEVSELKIIVKPPFYLSVWAWLLYIAAVGFAFWHGRRLFLRRQRMLLKVRQMEIEKRQQKELEDMKLRFFTNVSHEFRTPLMLVIQPLAQIIKKETDTARRETMQTIYRNAEKLLKLVNQLLDFRKMEMGGERLNAVTGDIVPFVRNICTSFRMLQDKNINLDFHSQIESLVMSFDDDKVEKIINNLLSNAYKFTDNGGIVKVTLSLEQCVEADSLRISKSPDDSEGEKQPDNAKILIIKIADTGRGISNEDKARVFDRFYQVDAEGGQPYGGSGVGLSLVHDFVCLHGGTIAVSDNEGGGTVFTLHLPVRYDVSLRHIDTGHMVSEAACVMSVGADDVVTVCDSGKPDGSEDKPVGRGAYEILIVDDSHDFLNFMADVLGEDYRVRTACDGKEALRMIGERKPDAVLSDVMMPVMDGIELCRVLKASSDTCRIPFVLLTARMAQEHKMEGLESGADDYITKPFSLDMLKLRVANLIKWRGSSGKGKIVPQVTEIEITSLDEKLVKDATEYVEKNMADADLSVETLSSAMNMSRVHLYKKLLSITGCTPSEFIRQIRMRRAEQLLRQSQLSVAEISYKVGINNPRSFSKYFKEMYGIMPSEYKKDV